ncbi:MAG: hypothetical protein N838_01870 [Thiohalocapsa sp. PB-PSB1]|nr:MAG: hypothetical protein N838_01870 [Thiohalocapsa sp. PB-PSB1]
MLNLNSKTCVKREHACSVRRQRLALVYCAYFVILPIRADA